jgi:DNA mismatch repair protein MutL
LEGFIVHPSQAKPSSRGQYIFLNGRAIEDRTVVAALREGFQGFLEPRLHPMAFLHLDIDPRQVDVNVHPAKTEVRFRASDTVFRLVQQTVKAALSRAVTIAPADMPMDAVVRREIVKAAAPMTSAPIQERFLPHQVEVQNRVEDRSVAYSAAPLPPVSLPVVMQPVQVVLPSIVEHRQETGKIQAGGPPAVPGVVQTALTELPPNVKRIVQLRKSWILVECDEGILILDQHALHEKALYTSLEGNTRTLDGGGIQNLLIPISVTLDTQRMETLRGILPALSQRGIEAEISGSSLQIRRHPQILARLDWQVFFEELATQLEQGHHNADPLAQALRALSHRSACKAAVKAGQELSQPELRELVRLYFSSPDLTHCPHGRPVAMRLSWTELERRFQR